MEKKERRTYTQEFKLEAVRLVHTGIPKARVARDLGWHRLWSKHCRSSNKVGTCLAVSGPEALRREWRLSGRLFPGK